MLATLKLGKDSKGRTTYAVYYPASKRLVKCANSREAGDKLNKANRPKVKS